MATMTSLVPGRNQEPGSASKFPIYVAEAQKLGQFSVALSMPLAGSWIRTGAIKQIGAGMGCQS